MAAFKNKMTPQKLVCTCCT